MNHDEIQKEQLVHLFEYVAGGKEQDSLQYYWKIKPTQTVSNKNLKCVFVDKKMEQDDESPEAEDLQEYFREINVIRLILNRCFNKISLTANPGTQKEQYLAEMMGAYGISGCTTEYPTADYNSYFATLATYEQNRNFKGPNSMNDKDYDYLIEWGKSKWSPMMQTAEPFYYYVNYDENYADYYTPKWIQNKLLYFKVREDAAKEFAQLCFALYLEANFGTVIDRLNEEDRKRIFSSLMQVVTEPTKEVLVELDRCAKAALTGNGLQHPALTQGRPYHGGNHPVRIVREVKRVPVVKHIPLEKRVEVPYVPPLEVKNCHCPPKTHYTISHAPNLRPLIDSHGTKIKLTFGKQDVPETVPCVTTLPKRSQTLETAKLVCRLRNYITDRGIGSLLSEGIEIDLKRPVTQADVGAMAEALLDVLALEEDEEDVHPPESLYENYSISRLGDRWVVVAPREDREQYLHVSSSEEGDIMDLIDSLSRDEDPVHNRKLLVAVDKAMDSEQRNAYARRGESMLAVLKEGHERVPQFVVDEHFEGNRKMADGHLLLLKKVGSDPIKLLEAKLTKPHYPAIASYLECH